MTKDSPEITLDGSAYMAGTSTFSTITPQLPPTNPKIKTLLSRALMDPENLSPAEVRAMRRRSSTTCYRKVEPSIYSGLEAVIERSGLACTVSGKAVFRPARSKFDADQGPKD